MRESQDLACGVFDTRGNMVAQSETGTPGHINAMATCMRHFMAAYPESTLAPGDVLITNDPWMTAGQINDVTLVTPIFRDGRVVAYFANTCHMADIGGRILSAEAREVYEEGLYIPITKLFDARRAQRGAVQDHSRQRAHAARGRGRPVRHGQLQRRRRRAAAGVHGRVRPRQHRPAGRGDHRPLRARDAGGDRAPAGRRVRERGLDSDGFEEPVLLKARVTVDGDELTVDHTGSSPQSRYGINVVMNYTHAYTSFAVKCAISPEVPHNEGSFRPVHVTAPPGCILNALHPAPVAARHLIGHFLPGLIFGALARAMPDRLMADGAASIWITMFRGQTSRSARTRTPSCCSSAAAPARGPTKDGLNNVGFPSGVAGVPAEVMESLTGLVVERKEVRPDSGGAGQVPRRLRPVHHVRRSQRPDVVDVGHVRPPRSSRPRACSAVRPGRRASSR